jgi:Uncharacterized protein conserved in bacteria (DUF2188)
MKRDAVYYVMPMGDIWLVRAIGSSANAYPTLEDALAAAERLAARGAHVRVLSRAATSDPLMPPLARTSIVDRAERSVDEDSEEARTAAS